MGEVHDSSVSVPCPPYEIYLTETRTLMQNDEK